MFEIKGAQGSAKIFTDYADEASVAQILELCNQPLAKNSKIRIMPDVHAGAGCTIGTTMTITDKIVPNLVGVDIGCLDAETEVMTPEGWISITDYQQQEILVYHPDTDTAVFTRPYAYIKEKCNLFYHFKSDKGLDQMLSEEHKMLIWRGYKGKGYRQEIGIAKQVFNDHNQHTKSNRSVKTTFRLMTSDTSLSEDELKLYVMISEDARLKYNKDQTKTYAELHFRKEGKIQRATELLNHLGIAFSQYQVSDESTYISFTLNKFVSQNLLQMCGYPDKEKTAVLIDELYHWDGTIDEKRNHKFYSTTSKENADYVQFLLATIGIRAGINVIHSKHENWNPTYRVYQTDNQYVGFPNTEFKTAESKDGYKYCFTTPTGFFIIRRNNCISITGNCGMETTVLKEKFIEPQKLDKLIRAEVPSGFAVRTSAHKYTQQIDLRKLYCFKHIHEQHALLSMGSLGGGNHFIEVDKGDDGTIYLVIHSGSRHLGVEVANYYQQEAYRRLNGSDDGSIKKLIAEFKAQGKQKQIESEIKKIKGTKFTSVPKHLAYCEGELFEQYLHDMRIVQEFAMLNRQAMTDVIVRGMHWHVRDQFTTTHNYIDIDNMILRKGSVSAQKDEILLIPMNMRDGSLICRGKGNPDWNDSAPHGAGRLMSRSKAKETCSIAEYRQQMKGIYTTSVGMDTIDECPMAYKPMEEIIANLEPTAEILEIIKPIYNFKAGGEDAPWQKKK